MKNEVRDAAIIAQARRGVPLQQLANRYGITLRRVQAIASGNGGRKLFAHISCYGPPPTDPVAHEERIQLYTKRAALRLPLFA